jgi:integrase
MRREHIDGGWWALPGEPDPALGWPGTKNGRTHRIWLSEPVRDLIADLEREEPGFVLANERGRAVDQLDGEMREICAALGVTDKVTPHDLRRTFSSRVTALGFGRDAMNRVTNHIEGGIADVTIATSTKPRTRQSWRRWRSVSSQSLPALTLTRSCRCEDEIPHTAIPLCVDEEVRAHKVTPARV